MKRTKQWLVVALMTVFGLFGMSNSNAACDHPFITQLPGGDLEYSVTFDSPQAYTEVFIKYDGNQVIAAPIGGMYDPVEDSYTYSYVVVGGTFEDGKTTRCRFYTYEAGQPGVFLPEPAGSWSAPVVIGEECGPIVIPDPCEALAEQYGDNTINVSSFTDGSVEYAVTYAAKQAYVEVFAKQNDLQNVAANITVSEVDNGDGTYTYSMIRDASKFVEGDAVKVRFYSFIAGVPGQVFVPGADASQWSGEFIYSADCGEEPDDSAVYVATWGDDANDGTIDNPLATIAAGISLAVADTASEVRIAGGEYMESGLNVVNGVSILGSYSQDFSSRDLADPASETIIMPSVMQRVLTADSIVDPTVVEGVHLTRGMIMSTGTYGGGNLLIVNCDEDFVVKNNKIDYGLVLGYTSYSHGGNVYIFNSTCKLMDNTILFGYAYAGSGDLRVEGTLPGPEVANNLFTTSSTVQAANSDFHDNSYLYRKGEGRDEIDSKVENNTLVIYHAIPESLVVDIYSISGSHIKTVKGTDRVSLQNMNSGIYLTKIQSANGYTTKKIFIQ